MKRLLLILLLMPLFAEAQIITTVAGGGSTIGDGEPATVAAITNPTRVAFDRLGNMYFSASGNKIRKVASDGIITTIAGTGTAGFSGDGGPATAAMINQPDGLSVDAGGNVYISDWYNNRIRKVDPTGIITTYAGTGVTSSGSNGDGGPATAAIINGGNANTLDVHGNLYVVDGYYKVRKIATSGIITTVVGNGIQGFSGDGGPATAAMITNAAGITFDNTGNMYITDFGNYRIRKISPSGTITTVAGTGLAGYTGDGGAATSATFSFNMMGIVADNSGNLFISDYGNNVVRKVTASGFISTLAGNGIQGYAGDGGPSTSAKLYDNRGVGIDSCGNVYICDEANQRIRKVTFDVCNALNIPDEIITQHSSVYPNPATTTLHISTVDKITTIAITNLLGQTIYTHEYNSPQIQVDVANLAKGIYFIKINGTEVRKFVKE